MEATLRQDGLIHRMALSGRGRAQCGATPPAHGYLNLSMHGVGVTCPRCIGESPAESIADQIAAAAAAFRAKHS